MLEIAAGCEDVFGLYEPFYREFPVTFPPWIGRLPIETVSHTTFKERTRSSRAVVRTGEFTPYANVILVAGVWGFSA